MSKKITIVLSILTMYLCYIIGLILENKGFPVQKILHISTDLTAGIGLIVIFIGFILRYYFPPRDTCALLSKTLLFSLIGMGIGSHVLMYHLHNALNLSSVNNDLCDAGWDLVELFAFLSMIILWEEYLKLRVKCNLQ